MSKNSEVAEITWQKAVPHDVVRHSRARAMRIRHRDHVPNYSCEPLSFRYFSLEKPVTHQRSFPDSEHFWHQQRMRKTKFPMTQSNEQPWGRSDIRVPGATHLREAGSRLVVTTYRTSFDVAIRTLNRTTLITRHRCDRQRLTLSVFVVRKFRTDSVFIVQDTRETNTSLDLTQTDNGKKIETALPGRRHHFHVHTVASLWGAMEGQGPLQNFGAWSQSSSRRSFIL